MIEREESPVDPGRRAFLMTKLAAGFAAGKLPLTFLALASAAMAQGRFTTELWNDIRPIYGRTLDHAYLKGLADGTLVRSRFDFYLEQDALYLRAFAQTLSVLAAKAPREEWSVTLNRHAVESLEVERQLHESLLRGRRSTAAAPVNYAYTNHLLATAFRQSFGHGLAAVLPCYWIYWEAGKELKKKGSKNPDYQRWIDQYADENYGRTVQQVLAMMDAEAKDASAAVRREWKDLFRISARYEWMFWDMAWREESWPPH